MEVNIIAFIATALFSLVYTALLLEIYVKTVSQNDEFEFFSIIEEMKERDLKKIESLK